MDAATALALIRSPQAHERLRGARQMARYATPAVLADLQLAYAEESVPWVRSAILNCLQALAPELYLADALRVDVDNNSNSARVNLSLRLGDEIVSTLLHEIQPKLGFIRNAASREVANFESSDTRWRIEYLENLLLLLGEFRRVSKSPKYAEFDLADLIDSVVAEEHLVERVQFAGPKPLLVQGEESRLRLAISNGLRNAAEATDLLSETSRTPIAVNWGATPTEYWISVIDKGIGLQAGADAIFNVGKSTKTGHYGMGLPMARQAIAALAGTVSVTPSDGGGTRFEIKWERLPNANVDGK
jgi:signal transduction histidine kinase